MVIVPVLLTKLSIGNKNEIIFLKDIIPTYFLLLSCLVTTVCVKKKLKKKNRTHKKNEKNRLFHTRQNVYFSSMYY